MARRPSMSLRRTEASWVTSLSGTCTVSCPAVRRSSARIRTTFRCSRSLAAGASGNYGLGALNKVIIDLEGGHVLVSAIGSGAVLGVVTDKEAKLGNIAYEMTLFANRAGSALSPQLVLELKNSVGAASKR